jgi:hypothetical protein
VDGHTFMHDIVRFSLPFGIAGKVVAKHRRSACDATAARSLCVVEAHR